MGRLCMTNLASRHQKTMRQSITTVLALLGIACLYVLSNMYFITIDSTFALIAIIVTAVTMQYDRYPEHC
jgi:hypothetical protein